MSAGPDVRDSKESNDTDAVPHKESTWIAGSCQSQSDDAMQDQNERRVRQHVTFSLLST